MPGTGYGLHGTLASVGGCVWLKMLIRIGNTRSCIEGVWIYDATMLLRLGQKWIVREILL